jgi:hypothetical protein
MRRVVLGGVLAVLLAGAEAPAGGVVTVRSPEELRRGLAGVGPGTVIAVAPGEYGGGYSLRGASGRPGAPIVIRAAEPARPPLFTGGRSAWHLSGCSHVTLQGLAIRGATGNGINVDDGGNPATPARHIVLEDLAITEVGPRGNLDGVKLSGVDDFAVRRCRFEGWGGSAIDMVGCHRGVISRCRFTGREGFSQANAVQMKGGAADIAVEACVFDRAGERAINIGGSTGLPYFRPRPEGFEARRITVAGSRFLGSLCAVAWVSADGGRVHRNTIQLPDRWVARILQEQTAPGFQPCRGGVFEENLVVFDRRVVATVNVGPGTAPASFTFRRNAWFQTDGQARPSLPSPEQEAVLQVDPRLDRPGSVEARATSPDARLRGIGADGWTPPQR